jgi:RNase adaptor protein for sRNA GlmZ degradation
MKNTNDLIESIASEHLDIETLTERKSDALDFHEISVWNLKKALQAAFEAGQQNFAS